MDTSAYGIKFGDNGQCNYCKDFAKKLKNSKPLDLKKLISSIKRNKNNKSKYDCIIGLSGGIDSSYTLAKAVEIGLNPLAVHLDNGWNSELAQNNIENLVFDTYLASFPLDEKKIYIKSDPHTLSLFELLKDDWLNKNHSKYNSNSM